MIIPLDVRFHGIFNGRGYVQVGRTRCYLVECVDGQFGVDESVLTNEYFLDNIRNNEDLAALLGGVYAALLETTERVEAKVDDEDHFDE